MDQFFAQIVFYLSHFSSEFLMIFEFLLYSLTILLAFKYTGLCGLFVFTSIAAILANVLALKTGKVFLQEDTIAMGTILYSMIFISTDIITEHYGSSAACRSLILTIFMQLVSVMILLIFLAYPNYSNCPSPELLPRILIASSIACLSSQLLDVFIFSKIRQLFSSRSSSPYHLLWLRFNVSILLASFIDSIIFSFFAWHILAYKPIDWGKLLKVYIYDDYLFRALILVLSTPTIYLSYKVKRTPTDQRSYL